jgi:hypothetical protein
MKNIMQYNQWGLLLQFLPNIFHFHYSIFIIISVIVVNLTVSTFDSHFIYYRKICLVIIIIKPVWERVSDDGLFLLKNPVKIFSWNLNLFLNTLFYMRATLLYIQSNKHGKFIQIIQFENNSWNLTVHICIFYNKKVLARSDISSLVSHNNATQKTWCKVVVSRNKLPINANKPQHNNNTKW